MGLGGKGAAIELANSVHRRHLFGYWNQMCGYIHGSRAYRPVMAKSRCKGSSRRKRKTQNGQTEMEFMTHRRPGRKKSPDSGVSHATRPALKASCPMHVTKKLVAGLPGLRCPEAWSVITDAIRQANRARLVRVIEFTVQGDHLHMLCEGGDAQAVGRGLGGLFTSVARQLNRLWERCGKVFSERYHREDLTTPTQVRNAIRYVLGNIYKHVEGIVRMTGGSGRLCPDPYSSGVWFGGYREPAGGLDRAALGGVAPCTVDGLSWLMRKGWRRLGLLSVLDGPVGAR